MQFTAIYQKHGGWYLGWIEEVPGVNTQGKTRHEVKENLKEALSLILEVHRSYIQKSRPRGRLTREKIRVTL